MTTFLGIISQKGGVGKSTLARLVAREYAAAGWRVKIADLDVAQGTSFNWQGRRLQRALEPEIPVERFGTVDQALRLAAHYDLLIFDSPPNATAGTLRVAQASTMTILPTGLALDDLEPSIVLAHELIHKGIPRERVFFALCRVGDSDVEIEEARQYIQKAGYMVLMGAIPEKIAYRRASDEGRTLTETRFASLNVRSEVVVQSIVDYLKRVEQRQERAHGEGAPTEEQQSAQRRATSRNRHSRKS
jgi:chromosome partitioning protein